MALRYRPMRAEDIDDCVQSVERHPRIGPTYAGLSSALAAAWSSLLGLDACCALLFEEQNGSDVRLIGPGVWVAVTDEFAAEIQRPPFVWIGPELACRIANGNSPVLSNQQFREANASAGLNIVAWPSGPLPDDAARMDVNYLYMDSFIERVRGHRLKQAVFQPSLVEEVQAVVQWGAAVATADGLQSDLSKVDLGGGTLDPWVLVMNAELAASRFGSWATALFVTADPRIGFSRSEQHLLDAALRGLTDDELALELDVSISAVKKTWLSIYSRVEGSGAPILPELPDDRADRTDRGKGKKHRLLNYVREHPEELRPVSMKVLRQHQAGSMKANHASPPKPRRRRVGRPRASR